MNTKTLARRRRYNFFFKWSCFAMTSLGLVILGLLLYSLASTGLKWLSFEFLDNFPSRFPSRAGIKAAISGSAWLIGLTALISLPIGIMSAIYLEEYGGRGRFARLIEVNIANLAGVPSIIYGLLGLSIFVRFMGLNRSLLAGALTLSLLILPVIIIATREAIRAVPQTLRQAAFALGVRKFHVVVGQVLPAALPGILTGIILAVSRAFGETAPLIMIGGLSFVAFTPENPMDPFTTLPIQIFNWASRPQEQFHELAAAAIIVLIGLLLLMNAVAIIIRYKTQTGINNGK